MVASSAPLSAFVRVLLVQCPSCPIPELLLKAANQLPDKAPKVSSWMWVQGNTLSSYGAERHRCCMAGLCSVPED